MITLMRITSPQLGRFVKDQLESHGIEVFFTNEEFSAGDKYDPGELLLKVKAGESEKAIATLLEIHKDYDLDKIRESPEAGLKKILVPVKLSEKCCMELCRYAMIVAKKIKAEVKLLYVYEDPMFNEPERPTASWEKYVKMELHEAYVKAQEKLVNFSKNLRESISEELFNGVKIHYRMLKGTPVNVITAACKRYKPDFILMGTKTKRDQDGEFLSRTLMKVIENTQYPVWAVPAMAGFKEGEKLEVMYATNFYESENSSLNKLLEILKPFDKKIHCVHIDLNVDPGIKEKVDELNTMLENEYGDYNIRCERFESDNILNGFDSFVEKNNIDLISLSKVKHTALYKMFHTDLTAKLVATRKVPVLIFPV